MTEFKTNEFKFKHLLFDLDGTLVANSGAIVTLDFMIRWVWRMRRMGGFLEAFRLLKEIDRTFKSAPNGQTNEQRVARLLTARAPLTLSESAHLMRYELSLIFPYLRRYFRSIKGARTFVNWAQNRYNLIAATNPVWPEEIIQMRMHWGNIPPEYFSFITHSSAMTACKPRPEYYREILSINGLNASECLHIGNEYRMDLPAVLAGIPVFIVGPYKKLTQIQMRKGHPAGVPAWKGNFDHLKELLEAAEAHSRTSESTKLLLNGPRLEPASEPSVL